MNKSIRPFHLAFPVLDIGKTKKWYTEILGCSVGRESEKWIDFNFFGHQISAHLIKREDTVISNPVDGSLTNGNCCTDGDANDSIQKLHKIHCTSLEPPILELELPQHEKRNNYFDHM